MMTRSVFRFSSLAMLLTALAAAPALAQVPQPDPTLPTQWMTAVRGGVGLGQTEGVAGVLWQSPAMGPAGYLRFRPAVNASFSSGQFTAGVNLDVVAEARIPGWKWSLLFGGGVSVLASHTSNNTCFAETCNGGSTTTAIGSHEMIVGLQNPNGLFVEVRAVAGLQHGTEVLAGYFFNRGKK